MKTVIMFFKYYDKNIVFRDCQMHNFNIYLRIKEILLIFFRHFVERPVKIFTWPTIIGLLWRH